MINLSEKDIENIIRANKTPVDFSQKWANSRVIYTAGIIAGMEMAISLIENIEDIQKLKRWLTENGITV